LKVFDWEIRLDELKGATPFIVIKKISAAAMTEPQPDDILSVHAEDETVSVYSFDLI
jgi:hypothetical protein